MISKIKSTSRITEVTDVAKQSINAYEASSLNTDVHLSTIFENIAEIMQRLTSLINRGKFLSTTDEYDVNRDENLRSFNSLLSGYLSYPDAAVQAAAETVNNVYKRYGLQIAKESYSRESTLLNALLEDLATPEITEALTVLPGCDTLLNKLQEAQTAFEAIRLNYEQEMVEEAQESSPTELKWELLKVFNEKLVVYLRAMYTVDKATYGTLTETIDIIVDGNNEVVMKRVKKDETTV